MFVLIFWEEGKFTRVLKSSWKMRLIIDKKKKEGSWKKYFSVLQKL